MPIKLTPESLTSQNRRWTAEVTPPEGGGRPWRSPGPMTVGDLMAALRMAGCSQTEIEKAFRDAYALFAQAFRDADAEEKYGPVLSAAFAGEYEPRPKDAIWEPLIAFVLFFDKKPESLAEVLDTADFILRGLPSADELAWAFLRLKERRWLAIQGNRYGLTEEGRHAIEAVVGRGGSGSWERVKQLEAWMASHPR